jgi:hypothetical protein
VKLRSVCKPANDRALQIINAANLEAFTIVQDVRTGALIAFAASQPSQLDVTTQVLPLSVVKLFLAASWWDHRPGESTVAGNSVHEMLVGGSDNAGRVIALALRRSLGTTSVLKDFQRYGFGVNEPFWGEVAPEWGTRLNPSAATLSLNDKTNDTDWANTLSIGETNMMVTGLHISRFLQAIGNDGMMLRPAARSGPAATSNQITNGRRRVMSATTARRLQAAMKDAVQRGSGREVAIALQLTGWQIGGKTGTGPNQIGPQSDGWFAGLIFDPKGKARFTVATFVRHGGRGGGNAARISAQLALFLIGGH